MTDLWLVSYLVLWGVVVILGLFVVGILRQIGTLQLQLGPRPQEPDEDIPIEEDGPLIGSPIPQLAAEACNGFGSVALAPVSQRAMEASFSCLCLPCVRGASTLSGR